MWRWMAPLLPSHLSVGSVIAVGPYTEPWPACRFDFLEATPPGDLGRLREEPSEVLRQGWHFPGQKGHIHLENCPRWAQARALM